MPQTAVPTNDDRIARIKRNAAMLQGALLAFASAQDPFEVLELRGEQATTWMFTGFSEVAAAIYADADALDAPTLHRAADRRTNGKAKKP